MAGHSKWSKIKRQKEALDSKKGALFTKLTKNITIAAKNGIADPNANIALRLAISKAKENGMPQANIKRALDKVAGNLKGAKYSDVVYEGYGPYGIALVINAFTDNKNRTVANIREILGKNGGKLGDSGCVKWQFKKRGIISIQKDKSYDIITQSILEYNIIDIQEGEYILVQCEQKDFNNILLSIQNSGGIIKDSSLSLCADEQILLSDEQTFTIKKLINTLENFDDVESVYSNLKQSLC